MTTIPTRGAPRFRFSSILFHYGARVCPWRLRGVDVAVLDPASDFVPIPDQGTGPRALAYTSVCEVLPTRPWFRHVPRQWLAGEHAAWGSRIVDQAAAGWARFFVEHVARPCWQAGYRGFFLDTLDSYRLLRPSRWPPEQQQRGIVRLVRHLRAAFPDATIISNRGFELMDALHTAVDAVGFESLYLGWDQQRLRYTRVPARDRRWLLAQASRMQALGLPVIAIDFCPPGQARRARAARRRIQAHGLIPCVSDSYFQTLAEPT